MHLSGIGLDAAVMRVVRCKFAAVLCCAPCCGESTQSRLTVTRLRFFSSPSPAFPNPSTLPKSPRPTTRSKMATCCYGARLQCAAVVVIPRERFLDDDTLSLMRQWRAPSPPIGCVHIAAGLRLGPARAVSRALSTTLAAVHPILDASLADHGLLDHPGPVLDYPGPHPAHDSPSCGIPHRMNPFRTSRSMPLIRPRTR